MREFVLMVVDLGCTADCDDDERIVRRVLVGASLFVMVVAPLWGGLYIAFGEVGPGLIPSSYSVISFLSFLALWRFGGWAWFRVSQQALIFVLPVALMWSLGGYVAGSAVVIWSLLAPLGAVWGGRSRESVAWFLAYVVIVGLSGVLDPVFRDSNELPEGLRIAFFALNGTFVPAAIFILLAWFVRQKGVAIDVIRRNRELEEAYLDQTISLRQSDKLATLGKLSAGLAHELNNPAAAVQQATHQLSALLLGDEQSELEAARLELEEAEADVLQSYGERIRLRTNQPEFIDSLERADRENEVQERLEAAGVPNAWDVAPALVALGLGPEDLGDLERVVRPEKLAGAVTMLAKQFQRHGLLGSLDESTERIIAMVRALKSYTHVDQTPRQMVDVHEGLDSTLVMLQSRLKAGIDVDRRYARDLPEIEAHAGELNQVWTNILDNAIDATKGHGSITLSTWQDGPCIVIELTDDGPGVPAHIVDQIFDPFVTSKAPGEGTGLGLNISHNIITRKHGGEIVLETKPGRTTFRVFLPIAATTGAAPDDESPSATDAARAGKD